MPASRRSAGGGGRRGTVPPDQALGGISVAGDPLLPCRSEDCRCGTWTASRSIATIVQIWCARSPMCSPGRPNPKLILDRLRNRGRVASLEEELAKELSVRSVSKDGSSGRASSRASCLGVLRLAVCRRRSRCRWTASAILPAPPGAAGDGTALSLDGRVLFPHSLGIFYQAMTQYLGFPHYGDEYKLMGLGGLRPAVIDRGGAPAGVACGRRRVST